MQLTLVFMTYSAEQYCLCFNLVHHAVMNATTPTTTTSTTTITTTATTTIYDKILVVGSFSRGSTSEVLATDGSESCSDPPDYPLEMESGVAAMIDGSPLYCSGKDGQTQCYRMDVGSNSWVLVWPVQIQDSYGLGRPDCENPGRLSAVVKNRVEWDWVYLITTPLNVGNYPR